jgi:RNA polymerase sigma-70 factor, ECF subfamily
MLLSRNDLMAATSWPELFIATWPHERREAKLSETGFTAQLRAFVDEAAAAWPGLALSRERFVAVAGTCAERSGIDLLARGHAADLFLAVACLERDPPALEAFNLEYLSSVDRLLAHMNPTSDERDEIAQTLRIDLFIGRAGGRPRLESYDGRGPLGAWLRVSAVRALLRLRRARVVMLATDEQLFERELSGESPDAQWLGYAPEFRRAFADAFAALSARDKTLLRQQVLDGASLDALGAIYRVHRVTVARWLAEIRRRLRDGTRARLRERLELTVSGCDSLVRALHGHVDLSLSRLLRDVSAES